MKKRESSWFSTILIFGTLWFLTGFPFTFLIKQRWVNVSAKIGYDTQVGVSEASWSTLSAELTEGEIKWAQENNVPLPVAEGAKIAAGLERDPVTGLPKAGTGKRVSMFDLLGMKVIETSAAFEENVDPTKPGPWGYCTAWTELIAHKLLNGVAEVAALKKICDGLGISWLRVYGSCGAGCIGWTQSLPTNWWRLMGPGFNPWNIMHAMEFTARYLVVDGKYFSAGRRAAIHSYNPNASDAEYTDPIINRADSLEASFKAAGLSLPVVEVQVADTTKAVTASATTSLSTAALSPATVTAPASSELVLHGSRSSDTVALTFDLCPTSPDFLGNYSQIVQILKDEEVPVTFFITKGWIDNHPTEAKALAEWPLFEFENHSSTHPDPTKVGPEAWVEEIRATNVSIKRLTGRKPVYFRLPHGFETVKDEALKAKILTIVAGEGMVPLEWSLVTGDPYDTPATTIVKAVQGVQAGDIIIAHANGNGYHTDEALPEVLKTIRAKGLRLVTVNQLLSGKPAQIEPTVPTLQPEAKSWESARQAIESLVGLPYKNFGYIDNDGNSCTWTGGAPTVDNVPGLNCGGLVLEVARSVFGSDKLKLEQIDVQRTDRTDPSGQDRLWFGFDEVMNIADLVGGTPLTGSNWKEGEGFLISDWTKLEFRQGFLYLGSLNKPNETAGRIHHHVVAILPANVGASVYEATDYQGSGTQEISLAELQKKYEELGIDDYRMFVVEIPLPGIAGPVVAQKSEKGEIRLNLLWTPALNITLKVAGVVSKVELAHKANQLLEETKPAADMAEFLAPRLKPIHNFITWVAGWPRMALNILHQALSKLTIAGQPRDLRLDPTLDWVILERR